MYVLFIFKVINLFLILIHYSVKLTHTDTHIRKVSLKSWQLL